MDHYAHKRDGPDGDIVWQTLPEHLRRAAEIAAECLKCCGLSSAGYLAGLLHDLGKYPDEFQEYLKWGDSSRRGSVIHSFQGCRFVLERFHVSEEGQYKIAAELLAYAVGAHHGLFDCVDDEKKIGLKYRRERPDIHSDEAEERFLRDCADEDEIERLFSQAAEELDRLLGQIDSGYADDAEYCFQLGMLARLLLSAVMEGDRRDTAEFTNGALFHNWPEDMRPIWSGRLRFLEEKLGRFPQNTPVERDVYKRQGCG